MLATASGSLLRVERLIWLIAKQLLQKCWQVVSPDVPVVRPFGFDIGVADTVLVELIVEFAIAPIRKSSMPQAIQNNFRFWLAPSTFSIKSGCVFDNSPWGVAALNAPTQANLSGCIIPLMIE